MFEYAYNDPAKIGYCLFVEEIIKKGNSLVKFVERIKKIEDFVHLGDQELLEILWIFKENNINTELVDRYEKKEFYHFISRIYLKGEYSDQ